MSAHGKLRPTTVIDSKRRDSVGPPKFAVSLGDTLLPPVWPTPPTFDGQLDVQHLPRWLKDMDRYFDWYNMTEEEMVDFEASKLTNDALKYVRHVDFVEMMSGKVGIQTWIEIKDILSKRYLTLTFVEPDYIDVSEMRHQLSMMYPQVTPREPDDVSLVSEPIIQDP